MLNQVKSSSRATGKKAPPLKAKKAAAKSPASRKKATKEKSESPNLATSFTQGVDKAHPEGHHKLNLRDESVPTTGIKSKPMDASAQNRLRPADDIRRKQRAMRRSGPIGQNTK